MRERLQSLSRAFSPHHRNSTMTQGFALGWEVAGLQPALPVVRNQDVRKDFENNP